MARPPCQQTTQLLLASLACGATVESAARKAGVSERTVYRRLEDKEFQSQLDRLRAEMVQRTAGMLTAAGMGSVKTLVDLQQDVSVAAGVRRRAARDILKLGLRFRETTVLEQRLANLEERFSVPHGGRSEEVQE